jgi:HTH-type transcriptional regulator, sugar sensing transcriptional regulator
MSKNIDENLENNIIDGLYELGLNGKEAQIYLALIKLGEVGTSKICKDTSLHRQFVYQFLDSLEKKGLVQNIIVKGRKKFSAKNPEVISKLLDYKKTIAEKIIKDISKIAKIPEEQIVEVNQGEDSYLLSAFELINKAENGTEILIIGGNGDKFMRILGNRLGEYEKLRIRKQIEIRYIGSEQQRENLENNDRELFKYHLLPGEFTDITHTVIWPNFITLDTFGVPVTQTIIHNPAVSTGYKEFFETLWNLGK